MATYEEAMTALRNADKAGDTESARKLAVIAQKLSVDAAPTPPADPSMSPGRAGLEAIQPSAPITPEAKGIESTGYGINDIVPKMKAGLDTARSNIGEIVAPLEGLGPAEMFGQVPKAIESGAASIPKVISSLGAAGEKIGGAGGGIKNAVKTVFGTDIKPAKADAVAAVAAHQP